VKLTPSNSNNNNKHLVRGSLGKFAAFDGDGDGNASTNCISCFGFISLGAKKANAPFG